MLSASAEALRRKGATLSFILVAGGGVEGVG